MVGLQMPEYARILCIVLISFDSELGSKIYSNKSLKFAAGVHPVS